MKVFSFCLSFFLMLILNLSCTKEKLPKVSENGANTFGCKIEGKAFVPQQTITYPTAPPLISYFNESTGDFELSASEDHDQSNNGLQRYFHLDIKNLTIGINKLNEISNAEISTSELNKNQSFTTTETIGGTLNITRLDTNAHVISGTFSFQAAIRPTNTPGKIITVADGRFDIKYK